MFLPKTSLDHSPPTYSLAHTWDHRYVPLCLAYLLRWGLTFPPWSGFKVRWAKSREAQRCGKKADNGGHLTVQRS
jgi:hypothetical protein